jgi:hypothetical protein
MVKYMLLIMAGFVACGCNHLDVAGLFIASSEGVQERFVHSREIAENLKVEGLDANEDYTFYVATDPHVDQTHMNLDVFTDTFRNDPEASFGVILGDCTDVRDNLSNYLAALSYSPERHGYDHKIYHVLGNHDIYFNGWSDFKEKVGPSTYWFEVCFPGGKDLFITLDSASGTLGSRQTRWLEEFIERHRSSYRHCVILTHTNFFYTDNSQVSSGNMPFEETCFLIDFLGRHDISLVLQGHDHYREDITYRNVRYTIVGAIADKCKAPEYLRVEVTPDGLNLDWCLISYI